MFPLLVLVFACCLPQRAYAQPAEDLAALNEQLLAVDTRLELLKRERQKYSPALPVVTMVTGGVVGVAGFLGGLAAWGHSDRMARIMGSSLGLSAALLISGGVWLAVRNRHRRRFTPELLSLGQQKRYLEFKLYPNLAPGQLGASMMLTGRF